MAMEIMKVSKGEIIIKEGQASEEMFYLKTGKLRVYKGDGEDKIYVGNIKEGSLVGELSFLDKQTRSATVEAVVECELVKIPREFYDKVVSDQPMWLSVLINTLGDRLRDATRRLTL